MRKIAKLNHAFLYCCLVALFCMPPKLFLTAQSAPPVGKAITLIVKNSSLADILRQVSKKSELMIYFQDADLAEFNNVSINVKNKAVESILHELLDGRGLTWVEISKSTIAIKKKEGQGNKERIFSPLDSTISVTGKVVKENGEPIPGATVLVKGSNAGATTNSDGSFKINDVRTNASLIITSVAFYTQEISVKGKNIIGTIILKEYIGVLDETVVVAYGTTTQRFSAGNVAVIKGEDIQRQPVSNPLLALAGRVPGVFISQSSGVSGGGVKIMIQGQNSILNGNEPFYVIDGVPYTPQLLPSLSPDLLGYSGVNNSQAGNPLNYINPYDIESISILKDADATAIYGSRAANGAILINTKKGKSGKMKLDLNIQQGYGHVTRKLELLNTKEYLDIRKEAITNDGLTVRPTYYDVNGVWDTTRYTDWQKVLLGSHSKYSNVRGALSGGNTSTQYLVSATYNRETAVYPGDFSDNKGSLHLNLNSKSNNELFHFQLAVNYLIDVNKLPGIDFTNLSIRLAPNAPSLYNPDGTLNWMPNSSGTSTWTNPLSNLLNEYSNRTKNLVGSSLLSYQILPGLELRSSFGYNNLSGNEIYTLPLTSQRPENRPNSTRAALYRNNSISSWIIEPQISYKRSISKSNISVLLGTTIQQNNNDALQLEGYGFNSDLVLKDAKAATTIAVSSTFTSLYKYDALFGRLNYTYDNKYVFNINARRDGTSRFGPESRFHNFASVSAAWIFSQEDFIKSNINFLSFGKLRASYGTTGNDQIGEYKYVSLYSPYGSGIAYQGIPSIAPVGLTNPYLQWEETKKLQLGVDFGILKDRILVNATYSRNRSSNQLLSYDLPIITGFSSIMSNFPAKVENESWELSANAIVSSNKKVNWTSSFNLTIPKNRLLEFPNLSSTPYNFALEIGQPLGIRKLFKSAGVDFNTGIYQFLDTHGTVTQNPNPLTDKTVIKSTLPTLFGGFKNTISVLGFELDVLFQFVKQEAPGYALGNIPGSRNNNQPKEILSRWKETGDNSPIQKVSTGITEDIANGYSNALDSDLSYSDASYIRLKNVSLTYQFPLSLIKSLHLRDLKIWAQGQNLLTITNYNGLDPENASIHNLPPLRILTIGVQVGF